MPERRGLIQALGYHDLFRHLSGNRQSISLVAAFHKQGQNLVRIYKKIHKEEELIDDNNSNSSRTRAHPHKNLLSLRISTEASVKLLSESLPLT